MDNKMWAGRFAKQLDHLADDFNSSIHFDARMYRQDIRGSIAHAAMLGACGILDAQDVASITQGLGEILQDLDDGTLTIDMSSEDIHMFIEAELTRRIGDAGRRLHTARSRNDQVALDIRLYLRDEAVEIRKLMLELLEAIVMQAKANTASIMPGYTHLQRAQPVTFAHYMLAYAQMLRRDIGRLDDAVSRMNFSPLGACALAGTTYATDRKMTAQAIGFEDATENSIDSVSDRDFCIELCACFATLMMHLSRLCEEIILWASWEFQFVELDDAYTTGSSIMPQKKNPDLAELIRGKTGRVYGDLITLLTMLKGLPLAYNKDMQEDKEAIFDAVDTVKKCLAVSIPMLETMKTKPESMYRAAQHGFINATDLADYLTKKGVPFRSAYKIVGQIVACCLEKKESLETLPLQTYQSFSPVFEQDLYSEISLETCVAKRISAGGTGPDSVSLQIQRITEYIKNEKNFY